MVSDIPARDGKIVNLFFTVQTIFLASILTTGGIQQYVYILYNSVFGLHSKDAI